MSYPIPAEYIDKLLEAVEKVLDEESTLLRVQYSLFR